MTDFTPLPRDWQASLLDEIGDGPAPMQTHTPPLLHDAIAFPDVIDNSTLTAFKACEKKHYWSSLRKAQTLDGSVHLVAGGAYARGLEVVRKRYFDHGDDFRTALNAGMRAAIIAYGTFTPYGKATAKTVWRILSAMEYHFTIWPINESLQPYRPTGTNKHTIEFTFAEPIDILHPVTGDPLLYAGRYDFLGLHPKIGLIGPVDDKTTSQLGEYWFNQWDMSGQMFGYIWSTRRKGLPAAGAFLRGVSILKTRHGNADHIIYANDDQIAEWYTNMRYMVGRMIDSWARGFWAKDYAKACSDFGGCSYRQLCLSSNPEPAVPINFSLNTWNPLDSRD